MTQSVQTAVIGVTGYAGAELARLLLHHPRLKGTPPVFAGRVDAEDAARGGVPLVDIHPQLGDNNGAGSLKLQPFSWDLLAERGVKVLFLATPHEQSREWVPEALDRGLRVIDLSGAWRLTDAPIAPSTNSKTKAPLSRPTHADQGRLRHAGAASHRDRRRAARRQSRLLRHLRHSRSAPAGCRGPRRSRPTASLPTPKAA